MATRVKPTDVYIPTESKWAKDQGGLLSFTPRQSQNGKVQDGLLLFTP